MIRMTSEAIHQVNIRVDGAILATGVDYEAFLHGDDFNGLHAEWVNGLVILMPSIDARHDLLSQFLSSLFAAYLSETGSGILLRDPFIMRLPNVPSGRAPDCQVILNERLGQLRTYELDGPANLVVEIVSKGTHRRDRVEKFAEYEQGGVDEYWVVDYLRKEGLFYQRNAEGLYEPAELDEAGVYHSRVLPGLSLQVALLWEKQLPNIVEVVNMVMQMLREPK
jgi:Uma2 family endonuclease